MLRSASTKAKQLSKISLYVLRVACSRCGRTVEIQRLDAIPLSGPSAGGKDVGQRLLDNTCQQRTGRHEEDGCWPSFEMSWVVVVGKGRCRRHCSRLGGPHLS